MSNDNRYWALILHLRPHQITQRHRPVVFAEDYDALRAAAGKVTCWRCEGYGELKSPYEEGAGMDDADPCPDCTDLRALLGEKP